MLYLIKEWGDDIQEWEVEEELEYGHQKGQEDRQDSLILLQWWEGEDHLGEEEAEEELEYSHLKGQEDHQDSLNLLQ